MGANPAGGRVQPEAPLPEALLLDPRAQLEHGELAALARLAALGDEAVLVAAAGFEEVVADVEAVVLLVVLGLGVLLLVGVLPVLVLAEDQLLPLGQDLGGVGAPLDRVGPGALLVLELLVAVGEPGVGLEVKAIGREIGRGGVGAVEGALDDGIHLGGEGGTEPDREQHGPHERPGRCRWHASSLRPGSWAAAV